MAIAAIGAIGTLLGGAAAAASTIGAKNRQGAQSDISNQQLQTARDNAQYQRMLNSLAAQRSVAGYQDDQGSSVEYDPYTNTWRSTQGQLPRQADTSALINTILKNTTDAQQQRFANERAGGRAVLAEQGADRAIRDFNTYQPVSDAAITGDLTTRAANANSDAYRNVLSDTLRQFARTGTASAPVIAGVGAQSAKDLRDSMVNARLTGMSTAAELNKSRLGTLGGTAQTASGLASPQFQQTAFQGSNRGDILANMTAANQRTAALAPIYGAGNVNQAVGLTGSAAKESVANVPNPNFDLNKIGELGNQIGSLTNKDSSFMKGVNTLFDSNGLFGSSTPGTGLTNWTNPALDFYNTSTKGWS